MKCSQHPEKDALAECSECNAYVCELCGVVSDGIMYCDQCLELEEPEELLPEKKVLPKEPPPEIFEEYKQYWRLATRHSGVGPNPIISLFSALIPPLAYLYIKDYDGSYKWGIPALLSELGGFLMLLKPGLIALQNVEVFGFFLIIIWLADVFDIMNKTSKIRKIRMDYVPLEFYSTEGIS
ncbi:MAG: hypothetical protein ACE5K4_00685 [Candidatus Hydrothermarchaeota archaeon]